MVVYILQLNSMFDTLFYYQGKCCTYVPYGSKVFINACTYISIFNTTAKSTYVFIALDNAHQCIRQICVAMVFDFRESQANQDTQAEMASQDALLVQNLN